MTCQFSSYMLTLYYSLSICHIANYKAKQYANFSVTTSNKISYRDRPTVFNNLQRPIMHIQKVKAKVESSNPVHGELYSIQHHVIHFVSDL